MNSFGLIYQYEPAVGKNQLREGRSPCKAKKSPRTAWQLRSFAFGLIALSLGGITGPLTPALRLEAEYRARQAVKAIQARQAKQEKPLPKSVPVVFNPLQTPDGASISPASRDFGLVIPKIGINTAVIPAVNPTDPGQYLSALKKGVAHASTSYFPDEDGTVYLFSHSTNYDWFVSDLNAVFYLLKNLAEGDLIVVYYKGSK